MPEKAAIAGVVQGHNLGKEDPYPIEYSNLFIKEIRSSQQIISTEFWAKSTYMRSNAEAAAPTFCGRACGLGNPRTQHLSGRCPEYRKSL